MDISDLWGIIEWYEESFSNVITYIQVLSAVLIRVTHIFHAKAKDKGSLLEKHRKREKMKQKEKF